MSRHSGGAMTSRLVTRNVTINGHRTSLRLQTEIWDALGEICQREGMTLNDLCSLIDERCNGNSRTSAVRAFVVTYYRTANHSGQTSSPSVSLAESDDDESLHPRMMRIGRTFRDLRIELTKLLNAGNVHIAYRQKSVLKEAYHLRSELLDFLAEVDDTLELADPLTGLSGRDGIFRRLERERIEIERSNTPCSIALVGLDHVEFIGGGYSNTDRILTTVAEYLIENSRQHDEIYRCDDHTFVLLLPRTTPDKGKRVMDRLRRGLARTAIRLDDGRVGSITASIGVAPVFPSDPSETTLERAESAMRTAREAGRNRVRIWETDRGEPNHPESMARAPYASPVEQTSQQPAKVD